MRDRISKEVDSVPDDTCDYSLAYPCTHASDYAQTHPHTPVRACMSMQIALNIFESKFNVTLF